MIITPDIFAKVYYNSEIHDLDEAAKTYCFKLANFEIPIDTDDVEKIKNFLRDRVFSCACGSYCVTIPYYIITKENIYRDKLSQIVYQKHPFKILLKDIKPVIDEYYQLFICCECGGWINDDGVCKRCGKMYQKLNIVNLKL
ncbi:MAG: hypothetical protein QW228_04785 [Candidatus Aenigmatarchaeota archaeon]